MVYKEYRTLLERGLRNYSTVEFLRLIDGSEEAHTEELLQNPKELAAHTEMAPAIRMRTAGSGHVLLMENSLITPLRDRAEDGPTMGRCRGCGRGHAVADSAQTKSA
jgi:hypothetical protein